MVRPAGSAGVVMGGGNLGATEMEAKGCGFNQTRILTATPSNETIMAETLRIVFLFTLLFKIASSCRCKFSSSRFNTLISESCIICDGFMVSS